MHYGESELLQIKSQALVSALKHIKGNIALSRKCTI